MRISKNDVPVQISIPGATARQQMDFGDAEDYGKMAGEYFSLAAGTDLTPLRKGLQDDLCQCPHWGYVLQGEITVTYTDGTEEVTAGNDLFYWPAGHTIKVQKDAEIILFSPQVEHGEVVGHLQKQLAG